VRNYTVKYTGTQAEKVIPYNIVTVIFNISNGKTVDLCSVLDGNKRFVKNSREYIKFLKKMYLFFIEKCECIPYISVDSGINSVIDARDDRLLSLAKDGFTKKINDLVFSINVDKAKLRIKQEKEIVNLEDELNKKVGLTFQSMEKDKNIYSQALQELREINDSGDHTSQPELKKLNESLSILNKTMIGSQSKHFNQEIELKSAVAKLGLEHGKQMSDIDVKVGKKINKVKADMRNTIDAIYEKFEEIRDSEVLAINEAISMKSDKKAKEEAEAKAKELNE
jgi:hypothetical protein